jgi:hypothetical protein
MRCPWTMIVASCSGDPPLPSMTVPPTMAVTPAIVDRRAASVEWEGKWVADVQAATRSIILHKELLVHERGRRIGHWIRLREENSKWTSPNSVETQISRLSFGRRRLMARMRRQFSAEISGSGLSRRAAPTAPPYWRPSSGIPSSKTKNR